LKIKNFRQYVEDQVDKEMHNVGDVSSKGSENLVAEDFKLEKKHDHLLQHFLKLMHQIYRPL
jgi:hypothetical protein